MRYTEWQTPDPTYCTIIESRSHTPLITSMISYTVLKPSIAFHESDPKYRSLRRFESRIQIELCPYPTNLNTTLQCFDSRTEPRSRCRLNFQTIRTPDKYISRCLKVINPIVGHSEQILLVM